MAFKAVHPSEIHLEPMEIRLYHARNPDSSPEMLRALSKDKFWYIRDSVASNVSTPEDCLYNLLEEKDFRIRIDAQKNLKTRGLWHGDMSKVSLSEKIYSAEAIAAGMSVSDSIDLDSVER